MSEKLEKLLKEKKLTIYRVSKDTGIPITCLYDWKAGRCNPKLDKLKILAEYFGVEISYFV